MGAISGEEAIAIANQYTNESLAGAGAVAGVPCQIQSITDITGGHRVTFLWVDNNGDSHTSSMDVLNGVDGQDGRDGADGKGIKAVTINEEGHLIITYSDDTTSDAGKIEIQSAVDSVNGKTGAVTLDASDVGALPDDTAIPTKTSNLTNDSGFITKAVNDLINYYLKSETYSKTEVDNIITAVKNSRFEYVATLPTTDIKTNVIYLVPKSPSQTSNVKDEYINLDGTTSGWEKIGDTEIDLSGYVTTQALNTALAAYTTTAELTTLLAAKQDTLTFDNAPTENSNNPVKSGGVYSADAKIYAEMTRQGVKNILSQQFDEVMITASLGNKATSANGLTLTYNSDGSIKINGTPTDSSKNVAIRFDWDTDNHPFDISYLAGKKIVASISENEINGIKIIPGYFDASDGAHQYSGADITTKGEYTYSNDAKWARCYMSISGAYSYSDVTVYPMIYIPFEGATDDYAPPTKTNQQLTEDTTGLIDNQNVNGAVNMLPYPYSDSNKVDHGVTFTDNGDGTVSVNGTASQDTVAAFYFTQPKSSYLPAGTYKLTVEGRVGTTASSSSPDWYYIYNQTTGQDLASPSRPIFTYNGTDTLFFRYTVAKGQTVSTTLKPMITVPSYNGNYVPYAKSNRKLTEDTASAIANITNGAINLAKPNSAGTTTVSDVEFVIDSEGKVTANGTASANIRFDMAEVTLKAGRTYKICEPSSLQTRRPFNPETYRCYARIKSSGVWVLQNNGWKENYTPTEDVVVSVGIAMQSGNEVTDEIFAPMLVLDGTDVGNTFYPYAKTNRELTENVTSLNAMYDGKAPSAVSDLNVPLTAGGATLAFTRHLNNTTNAPTNGGGLEITWSSSDKYGAQLTLTDGGLYFRTNNNGTISAWQKIST